MSVLILKQVLVMGDHEFARWLRNHGWTGTYKTNPDNKTTTYYDYAGEILAKQVVNNTTCKTIALFIKE